MEIHPDAMTSGITRHGVYRATQQALLTTHIGNGPTQIFMIGRDESGQLLEISAVVRHEDILVVHADHARSEYMSLLDGLPDRPKDDDGFGRAADGLVLTDALILNLFHDADTGYDTEYLSKRTRPGRPAPMTVGTAVRLGMGASLYKTVTHAAAVEGKTEARYVEDILHYAAVATPS